MRIPFYGCRHASNSFSEHGDWSRLLLESCPPVDHILPPKSILDIYIITWHSNFYPPSFHPFHCLPQNPPPSTTLPRASRYCGSSSTAPAPPDAPVARAARRSKRSTPTERSQRSASSWRPAEAFAAGFGVRKRVPRGGTEKRMEEPNALGTAHILGSNPKSFGSSSDFASIIC